MRETVAPAAVGLRPRAPGWSRIAFYIVFAALAVHAAISSCDHDEIEHLHAAFLVGQGQRPFADFLEHHAPLLWFLLAPLTRLFHDDVQSLVLACRLINLGAAALALKAVDRLPPILERTGLAAVLLLGSWFHLRNSLEVRPDPLMAAFAAWGLCAFLRHLRTGAARDALLAGACVGMATVLLQKAAAFGFLLLLGSGLAALREKNLRAFFRSAILFLSAAALPICAAAIWLARLGILRDFLFWNVSFNRYAYLEAKLDVLSPWETLAVAVGEQPLLWIAGLVAALATAWRFARGRVDAAELICAALVLGMLAAFARSAFPYSHNLLMIGPPLALLAAQAIERRGPLLRRAAQVVSAILIAKCLVLCAVYQENQGHREVQDWILRNSRPGDLVFAPPPFNPIFRKDPSYFWFDVQLKTRLFSELCETAACIDLLARDEQAWTDRPPEMVYLPPEDPSSWPTRWPRFAARYREAPGVRGLFLLGEKALVQSELR